MSSPTVRRPVLVLACLALVACRKGSEQSGGTQPVFAAPSGTQGCAPAGTPVTALEVFAHADLGPLSQIAAATGASAADLFYWTGKNGSVHELTLPDAGPLSDVVLLPQGVIETTYLLPKITAPAELSGVAVIDASFLAVAEHASNTVLLVDRAPPVEARRLVGTLDPLGGFSPVPGTSGPILFRFTGPVPLLVDASGLLWIGDTGNHAVRRFLLGSAPPAVEIVAGSGAAGAVSGSLGQTLFDTPSGFAASCGGELLLVESGAAGVGGNVLTSLRIGTPSPFGGLGGSSLVLAGDGIEETRQGVGGLARLAMPAGLAATADGRVFWMDTSGTPILRRYTFATGLADCPMFADCTTALASPSPFVGEHFSLALGESGALYVLATTDASGGRLYRVE